MPDKDPLLKIALPDDKGTFEFDPKRYLTAPVLSHFKQWYSPELGQWWPFQVRLSQGYAKAVACAVWAIRRKEGITPNDDPRTMADFSVPKAGLVPNRGADAKPAKLILRLPDEDDLTFEVDEHLTFRNLERAERWCGENYGSVRSFEMLLLMGDSDAMYCAINFAKRAKGITPNPKPADMVNELSFGSVVVEPNQGDDDEDTVPSPPPPPPRHQEAEQAEGFTGTPPGD